MRALPLLATSALLLSGCGVAGTQFHPGIAAQVGDVQITDRHVDEISDSYCRAIEKVSADQGGAQRIPMRYLTHEFVNTLVVEAATKQVAAQYDVEPGDTYRTTLSQLEPQLVALSSSEKAAVREIEGAQAYYQDVLTAVGDQVLADQGSDTAADDDSAAAAAGQKVLDAWFDDHDVEVNPRYAFAYGSPSQVDTDTSLAVSAAAKDGLEDQPSEGYAAALPDNLVCGG